MIDVPGIAAMAIAFAILAVTVLIIAGLIRLLRRSDRPSDTDDPDSDSGAGGGGGGLPPNDRPPGSGGGAGEPVWWPRFEREFAEYVARARALSR